MDTVNNMVGNVESEVSKDLNEVGKLVNYTEDQAVNFVKKLTDNRVLDLYLKYMGITLVSPAALVPFGLLLGRDFFEYAVKRLSQSGGRLPEIPDDIPVVDDELFGFYLKILGLGSLSTVSPMTLVPLGVIMYLYDSFVKNQVGGGGCSGRRKMHGAGGCSGRRKMHGGNYFDFQSGLSPLVDTSVPPPAVMGQYYAVPPSLVMTPVVVQPVTPTQTGGLYRLYNRRY